MPAILDKIAHALHLDKGKEATPVEATSTEPSAMATSAEAARTPVFDHNKVTVIFVLGGPGAGELSHY
jgi:UMP-CMP kinase